MIFENLQGQYSRTLELCFPPLDDLLLFLILTIEFQPIQVIFDI